MTLERPWRFRVKPGRIYIRAGKNRGPLAWLPTREIRAFADALHDLADDIERQERER